MQRDHPAIGSEQREIVGYFGETKKEGSPTETPEHSLSYFPDTVN